MKGDFVSKPIECYIFFGNNILKFNTMSYKVETHFLMLGRM